MSNQQNERVIDIFLNKKITIAKIKFKCVDLLYIFIIWILAFVMRYQLFPIVSADYSGFLESWFAQIRNSGAWNALGQNISNYTSPYMYIMSMLCNTSNSMYALKYVSVFFDYAASLAVFLLIFEMTLDISKSIIAMSLFLLSPAVVLNGAYWCQCDVIYATFVLFALLMFVKGRSRTCFILLGVAFSFKLQTLFIIPFFIIMWLKNKTVKLIHMLYIPLTYVIMHIPAWIAGRPIKEWLFIYFDQAGYYPWGTLNYPNIYTFFDEGITSNHYMNEISGAGLFITIILMGILAYYFYNKKVQLNNDLMITLALFSELLIVFTLPHMHERYGFMVDVIAVIYAILRPKKSYIMIGVMLITICIYMPYLIAVDIFPMKNIALALLGIIIFVGKDLYEQISVNQQLEDN